METSDEEVINLEFDSGAISCYKDVLIKNSDYFKAMLDGGFLESNKKYIKINAVRLDDFKTILEILENKAVYLNDEDALCSVLETASMLQFLDIIKYCSKKLIHLLNIDNCLKIWFLAECLNVKPLYTKAKLLALLEFDSISGRLDFFNLNLDQVCAYLGSIHLKTHHERIVVDAAFNWYTRQRGKCDLVVDSLLSCIDFTKLTLLDITLIQDNCEKNKFFTKFSEKTKSNTVTRRGLHSPCLVLQQADPTLKERQRFVRDQFGRKRPYSAVISEPCRTIVLHIDHGDDELDLKEIANLSHLPSVGCSVVGLNQNLCFCGGESLIGQGNWNTKTLLYNFAKEESWSCRRDWEFKRRHFNTVVTEKYFFIIGGTAPFRIRLSDALVFDLETEEMFLCPLPRLSTLQTLSCNFDDNLFILDINVGLGYLFKVRNFDLIAKTYKIDHHSLPKYSKDLVLFYYKSSLYVKDFGEVYEFKLYENFEFQRLYVFDQARKFDRLDSVLCNDYFYTLLVDMEDSSRLVLEIFHLDKFKIYLHDIDANKLSTYKDPSQFSLLTVCHYHILDNDERIH